MIVPKMRGAGGHAPGTESFEGDRVLVRWFAAAVVVVALAGSARADDPSFLTLGAGVYDFGKKHESAMVQAEWRGERALWHFKPIVGAAVEQHGAGYVYAGILLDVFLSNRVVLTGSFAPSFYWEGGGKDLGLPLEFRSGIELAWRFDDRSRLGVSLHHLSNASLGDINPGMETVLVYYALPIGTLF